MKPTILFVILPLLSACSLGRKTPNPSVGIKPVPMSALSKSDTESLRSAEKLKAYPLGRYIDPNNSRIMHEAHTLYRVESPSSWNLRPGPAVSLPLVRVSDSAKVTSPEGAELLVELNRQKQTTAAVIQSSQTVSKSLGEISAQLEQSKRQTEQNSRLEQDLVSTKERLSRLEAELQSQPTRGVSEPVSLKSGTLSSDW